jgi:hypothetical protein
MSTPQIFNASPVLRDSYYNALRARLALTKVLMLRTYIWHPNA